MIHRVPNFLLYQKEKQAENMLNSDNHINNQATGLSLPHLLSQHDGLAFKVPWPKEKMQPKSVMNVPEPWDFAFSRERGQKTQP